MAELKCEKCQQGVMLQRSVYRLSGCLVAIGYLLLAISFGSTLVGCLVGGTMMAASGAVGTAAVSNDMTTLTIKRLKEFSVPDSFIREFEQRHTITPEMLDTLPKEQHDRLTIMMSAHAAARGATVVGSGAVGMAGLGTCIAAFMAAVPTFIIGFLLILRRSVKACSACGWAYDSVQ